MLVICGGKKPKPLPDKITEKIVARNKIPIKLRQEIKKHVRLTLEEGTAVLPKKHNADRQPLPLLPSGLNPEVWGR